LNARNGEVSREEVEAWRVCTRGYLGGQPSINFKLSSLKGHKTYSIPF